VPQEFLTPKVWKIAVEYGIEHKVGGLLLYTLEKMPQELFTQQLINELIEHVKIERHNQSIKDKAKSFAGMNDLKDGGISDDALVKESKKIPSLFWTAEITQICFDVIKRNGNWIQYIPEERITQEMCEDAVNSKPAALEHVPDQYKTQAMCDRWADDQLKDAATLRKLKLVPRECMTQKIEEKTIEIIGVKPRQYFTNIPRQVRTPSISLFAVKNGVDIRDVPQDFWSSELFYHAVKLSPRVLKDCPPELKTGEICLEAVKQDGDLFLEVPDNLKTAEICLEAVKHDGEMLHYTPETLKTAEVCLEAVKTAGRIYDLIPENIRTPEMLETAKKNFYIEKVSAGQINTMDNYIKVLVDQVRFMPPETQAAMLNAIPEVQREQIRKALAEAKK